MRTTLNLDDDVAAQLRDQARKRGLSLSRVANEFLRTGIREGRKKTKLPPYVPPTFDTGPLLIDVTDVAVALEVLDDIDRVD